MREELAKLIFFADNKNIPTSYLEDGWAKRHDIFRAGELEYVYAIADAILGAGWHPNKEDS